MKYVADMGLTGNRNISNNQETPFLRLFYEDAVCIPSIPHQGELRTPWRAKYALVGFTHKPHGIFVEEPPGQFIFTNH